MLRLSILLLLVGCANTDTIQPVANRIHTITQFYDDIDQLRAACSSAGNPNAKGCASWNKDHSYCYIRVMKSQRCLDHENDHCYFGDFHSRTVNTPCEVRAGG